MRRQFSSVPICPPLCVAAVFVFLQRLFLVVHLLHFLCFRFSFDLSAPITSCSWDHACHTNTISSVCHLTANTCAAATASHLLYKISLSCAYEFMILKKIMPSLGYVWISKALCHWFHYKVLAGCLCATRPGLARTQYVCHGVASLCIPLCYIFSGLRRTSQRSERHKSTKTHFRVQQLVFFQVNLKFCAPTWEENHRSSAAGHMGGVRKGVVGWMKTKWSSCLWTWKLDL